MPGIEGASFFTLLAGSAEPVQLVTDLGLVTLAAALVALIFHALRIPVFLGYVLAGLLLGSDSMPWAPLVRLEAITDLKEMGVVFLMFYIGLEMDLSILRRVLAPAFTALCLQTAAFLFLGLQVAPLIGYSSTQGLFLGGILAISSSMVTISVLQELGRLRMPHGQLALGVLILEDVVAVALLVILSGVGLSGRFDWGNVWAVSLGLGIFVVLVFFLGKLVAPSAVRLMEKVARPELLTLSVVGVVLGVSMLAQELDFSVALGAFLAGSILSQTSLSDEIEHATASLRSLFLAVFFVAVGMIIDLGLLIDNAWIILLLSFLTVTVKIATCWLGFFLGGQRASSAFRASVAKAQIGEFGFIIAGLAISLGVNDNDLMAIAVGVSMISSTCALLMTVRSDALFEAVRRRSPQAFLQIFSFYGTFRGSIQQSLGRSMVLKLTRRPLLQIVLNLFLVAGFIAAGSILSNWLEAEIEPATSEWLIPVVWLPVALVVALFAIAIIRNLNAIVLILSEAAFGAVAAQEQFKGRLRNIFHNLVLVLVAVLIGGFFFAVASTHLPTGVGLTGFILTLGLAGIFSWRHMIRVNSQVELLFMRSFEQQTSNVDATARQNALREISEKYPWPVVLHEYNVKPGTAAAGQNLKTLGLREKTGTSIVAFSRQGTVQYNPDADFQIFPGDHLFLFGEQTQIDDARRLLDQTSDATSAPLSGPASFEVEQLFIDAASELAGNTLAGANLRRQHGVTVLGIQRGDRRTTSPGPEEILQPGDVLYVIGDRSGIERLQKGTPTAGPDTPTGTPEPEPATTP
ncbi:MAG: cation:proton antiporter [Opitutales bacterium]